MESMEGTRTSPYDTVIAKKVVSIHMYPIPNPLSKSYTYIGRKLNGGGEAVTRVWQRHNVD